MKAEKKAQLYYKSCLDEEEIIEKLGSKPMLDLLQQLGDWNVTNKNFSTSKWTLQHTLQIVHNKFNMGGMYPFILYKHHN